MRLKIIRTICLLVVLFISTSVTAQYSISKSVFGNGGKNMQNSSYKVNATIGQSTVGIIKNSVQQSKIGYWYQVNIMITKVEPQPDDFPKEYKLYQNYPNPFNPTTRIKFAIPKQTHPLIPSREGKEQSGRGMFINLNVYDILGKQVATLVNETKQPGIYEVTFNAKDLPSGVYVYKIRVGSFVQSRKLLLMK